MFRLPLTRFSTNAFRALGSAATSRFPGTLPRVWVPCSSRCLATRAGAAVAGSGSGSSRSSPAALQLAQLIDQEVSDVGAHSSSKREQELAVFIREFKFNVQVSAGGARITATRRTDQGIQITVDFPTLPDESEDSDEYVSESEQNDVDEMDEQQEDGEQDHDDDLQTQKPHYFHIDITNRGGSFVRLFCLATPEQKLDIYQVAFDKDVALAASSDSVSESESTSSEVALLNWDDLSDEVASGFADYLHHDLNIDDDLASFVQAYSENVRSDQYVAKMKQLKQFLQTA